MANSSMNIIRIQHTTIQQVQDIIVQHQDAFAPYITPDTHMRTVAHQHVEVQVITRECYMESIVEPFTKHFPFVTYEGYEPHNAESLTRKYQHGERVYEAYICEAHTCAVDNTYTCETSPQYVAAHFA